MSAPRKIWVNAGGNSQTYLDRPNVNHGILYHHDDVLQHLVEELQAALSYFDHHGITGGSVDTTRAALAKIAQEDQR